MRFVTFALLLPLAVPLACGGDTETTPGGTAGQPSAGTAGQAGSSGGSAGSSAGKGGSAGKAGATSGGSAGTSTGGAGTGGGAGEGGESGEASGGTAMGGEAGMGDAGMGATGGTAGAATGGTAGATAGGAGTAGTAGAGAGGAGNGGTAGGAGNGGGAGTSAGGASAGSGGVAGTAGVGGGGSGSETLCSDSIDNDGDTYADCADPDCAAACSLTCPSGTSKVVYRASVLPVAIPENNPNNPAVATITIPDAGLVSNFALQTSITHPYVSDLDLFLVTPYGTREVSTDNGGGGDNYTNTVFNDTAGTAITAGTAPFTNSYRPEQAFTPLSGMALQGTYELRVGDDSVGDTGQVTNFSLAVCQCLAGSGNCEFGPYACMNGIDDDGDDLVDCEEADCAGSDVCPALETACGDSTDNDGNGQTDCADAACSWACTALGSACTSPDQIFVYRPTNLPLTIPITTASLPAPISVAAQGTLVAAAVRFSATHSWTGDLTLRLASPFGLDRLLTGGNGNSGDNYTNTVFLDSAATSITAGTAPFTGSYQPEEPLTSWTGATVAGVWPGVLYDNVDDDGGSFNDLALGLCVAE